MGNAFSSLLNPDKDGTLTGFLGGVMGNPTASQYQGQGMGQAAQSISSLMQEKGLNPQQAVIEFMKSPGGMDFFTSQGPQGMEQLSKLISNVTPPDPKAIGIKPGETGVISQGGKVIAGPMSVPTSEVQTFNQFAKIAQASPERIRELADLTMDPTAKNTSAKERAVDAMVKAGVVDENTGNKLKAGVYQTVPAKDGYGNTTGDVAILDMTDPTHPQSVLIRPSAPVTPGGAANSATPPDPAKPVTGGVTPDTGAGTGVLPPTKAGTSVFDTGANSYFGSKANMFLGAGVVPNVLGAASKLTEQIDPSLIIPGGAVANDRKTLIDQTRNAIAAMGAEGTGWGINRATLKTFLELVPSAEMTDSPHASAQKGVRLLQKVQEEIAAEHAITQDPNVPAQEKVNAAKRIEGWRRVERTLPTMEEMAAMEKSIREGTAGAETIAGGAKKLINEAGRIGTTVKKQGQQIQSDVNTVTGANPYASMSVPQLLQVDPRKLSREQIIQFRNRINELKAAGDNGSARPTAQ